MARSKIYTKHKRKCCKRVITLKMVMILPRFVYRLFFFLPKDAMQMISVATRVLFWCLCMFCMWCVCMYVYVTSQQDVFSLR